MEKLTELVQSGDWAKEKHVPSLQVSKCEKGIKITTQVGAEIAHPNTLEHHISWIKVYFKPEGAKFPIEVGTYEFTSHGEEEIFSTPKVETFIETQKSGTVYALSYCNVHGLWENSVSL